jgi:hypothetical protein
MKESELLGKLMLGHPDLLPIIENIRFPKLGQKMMI